MGGQRTLLSPPKKWSKTRTLWYFITNNKTEEGWRWNVPINSVLLKRSDVLYPIRQAHFQRKWKIFHNHEVTCKLYKSWLRLVYTNNKSQPKMRRKYKYMWYYSSILRIWDQTDGIFEPRCFFPTQRHKASISNSETHNWENRLLKRQKIKGGKKR